MPAKLSPDGNPAARILLAIEDITSRKQIEDELLRSYEDAQRFAFVAAHDLRAPLNTAMMLLQLLSQKTGAKLEEDERQALSMAKDNLQRLKCLMGDILSYSQVGGSENKLSVPLQEPLQMALANLQKDIEETKTEVSFGPLPTVKADRFPIDAGVSEPDWQCHQIPLRRAAPAPDWRQPGSSANTSYRWPITVKASIPNMPSRFSCRSNACMAQRRPAAGLAWQPANELSSGWADASGRKRRRERARRFISLCPTTAVVNGRVGLQGQDSEASRRAGGSRRLTFGNA